MYNVLYFIFVIKEAIINIICKLKELNSRVRKGIYSSNVVYLRVLTLDVWS